ncbi:nucleotidyltransferase family protein [Arhodomonas sp. SL1]|uniref:nucleotidyltransferase family protein n=1 Tax=Arhodomonas sp. SL1 TaxID=3425691 RepID=UPI003F8812E9
MDRLTMQEPIQSAAASSTARRRVTELVGQAAEAIREELGRDTRIIWFGSWVSGHAVDRSDIDLAIEPAQRLDPPQRERLRERLEALPTLYSFDLVMLPEVASRLRGEIERNGTEV